MKIEFENEQEKECLIHILSDWFNHNGQWDVLGCEPACRDEDSPGCYYCIEKTIANSINKYNAIYFWNFGGEECIMEQSVEKYMAGMGTTSSENS